MNRQETHGSKIARKRDEGAKETGDFKKDFKTCRDGCRQETFCGQKKTCGPKKACETCRDGLQWEIFCV
ncbi:hypothetical protein HZ326_27490 [Fusarium oxysporum f. sp. albedinis]|nr:hypothetical protein HZ326_27490 [Fusarium oxysporum f. sp. albedinis]